jgi:hypothetical protein
MPAISEINQPKYFALDSITKLSALHEGHVVISGSHGGVYPGYLAARGKLRGVIFSDAGVGLESAGIGSLPLLAGIGLAAATVDYRTARIGDGEDIRRRGIVSYVNGPAAAVGCREGEAASLCAEKMLDAQAPLRVTAAPAEGRTLLRAEPPRIWAADSNALITADDVGTIAVTGSHGGLLGGKPASAIGPAVIAAAFNDAGMGSENAGISRLPALDVRGIVGVTVSAWSARIGDARSSWATGVISAANDLARRHGAKPGDKLKDFFITLAERLG